MPSPAASLAPTQAASASIASSILNGAQPAMAGHMQTVAKTYDASTPKQMIFNGKPAGRPFYRGDLQQQPGPTNTIGNINENTGVFNRYQGASGHTAQSTSVGRFIGAGVGAGMSATAPAPAPTANKQGSHNMTGKQLFKLAFLSKCIEDGLTMEQMCERAKQALHFSEKRALFGIDDLISKGGDALTATIGAGGKVLGGLASNLPWMAGAAAVGAPLAAGYYIGGPLSYNMLSKPNLPTKEEMMQEELLNEYEKQTKQLKQQSELAKRRKERSKGISGVTRY